MSACYSGQYHFKQPENVFLITSSKEDEISDTNDFENIVDMPLYFDNNKPNAAGIMRFIAEKWSSSCPHFSGLIGDKKLQGIPLKDAVTAMSSNHSHSHVQDSNRSPEEESIFPTATNMSSSKKIEKFLSNTSKDSEAELQLVSLKYYFHSEDVSTTAVSSFNGSTTVDRPHTNEAIISDLPSNEIDSTSVLGMSSTENLSDV